MIARLGGSLTGEKYKESRLKLDGIFLDLYGTLTTGDRDAVESVCQDVVRDTGTRISAHELSITWGDRFFHYLDFCSNETFQTLFDVEQKTLVETMKGLGVDVDPLPYAKKLKNYWQNPPIQTDVRRFFANCRLPVCIVSNADREDAEAVVRGNELPIAELVTSEDARSYKPDRQIFEQALRQTGWDRERVIHVGDSLHSDIGGAIVAGIRNGWLNRQHRIHDIGTHQPNYEFADLDALSTLLSM